MQPEPVPDPVNAPSSPERLLAACATGERAAFQALYREFSPAAYGLAMRVLRDDHRAQDALQEAFTQVWTDALRFDPQAGSARAWIMTLVHRRAVDRVRRDQADRQRGRAWGTGQLDVDHDSVAEIVELRAEHRRVRSALAALTPLQRQALDLAYHRGMTQTQIADHLDIPLGTAKTRLRDALQRLRLEMKGTS
jgi:RNA polymerase sigma-70 factor (ECF subfamily)